MPHTIKVNEPIEYDPALVAAVLGEDALPIDVTDRALAPFITVNGRIHTPTSNFLRHHCTIRPNLATARRLASDLAGWLDYLCNTRGLHPYEDRRDPALTATEDHFAAYYRQRQYGTDDKARFTSGGWAHAASAIKRFYEYAQRHYQHLPPFEIITVTRRDGGTGTTIAKYQPRRRNTGSAGIPITPEFAQYLLMGALRTDLDGNQVPYLGADRDHALFALGLATGVRRNNLANITVYEIPPASRLPLTTMRVADHITKGDAGGDALVFTHHLAAVREYLDGARADLVARTTYRPARPLHIESADSTTVRYRTPDDPDTVASKRWTDADADFRRRLVTPEGASPVVFLNEYTGEPLAYRSLQHAIETARTFVRERIDRDFPENYRIHDLRHTYAVHLTVAIYRGVVADIVEKQRRDDWTVDHIAAAVELVKFSLGHASEQSTRLYTQTAHRFLGIPVDHFVGRF
ncbi:hypothetical protein OG470_15235 [Micromonospora sp. NBC_00389]|uniref:hypothetical protein n=1 Tax=Micromonospora sp. NBC_00389 TaxID=2903586 RepID=UPI002E247233